jgi:hypothetical protein
VIEANLEKAEIQQKVRNRQETVNKRFKNWAILLNPYRHKLLEHQTVFGAIFVLTELFLADNPLFQVEYNDKLTGYSTMPLFVALLGNLVGD